jgi:hypothetical protein
VGRVGLLPRNSERWKHSVALLLAARCAKTHTSSNPGAPAVRQSGDRRIATGDEALAGEVRRGDLRAWPAPSVLYLREHNLSEDRREYQARSARPESVLQQAMRDYDAAGIMFRDMFTQDRAAREAKAIRGWIESYLPKDCKP